jgi:hypothetical protein
MREGKRCGFGCLLGIKRHKFSGAVFVQHCAGFFARGEFIDGF